MFIFVFIHVFNIIFCLCSSCVIWQLDKGKKKRVWKTLNNSVIALIEEAYLDERKEVRVKNLAVSLVCVHSSPEPYSC